MVESISKRTLLCALVLTLAGGMASTASATVIGHVPTADNTASAANIQVYFDPISGQTSHSTFSGARFFFTRTTSDNSNFGTVQSPDLISDYQGNPCRCVVARLGNGEEISTQPYQDHPGGGGTITLNLHAFSSPPWTPLPILGFVALLMEISGETHYAWAYLSLDADNNITLESFAYNDEPGGSILTDDLMVPVSSGNWSEFKKLY